GVSSKVQAVCDYFGPTDFARIGASTNAQGAVGKLLGGAPAEKKELAEKASPLTYVSKDDPPFLILHGDQDPLVPLGQSELLLEALKKAGVQAELLVAPGVGHNPQVGTGDNAPKIAAFFDKHLKGK